MKRQKYISLLLLPACMLVLLASCKATGPGNDIPPPEESAQTDLSTPEAPEEKNETISPSLLPAGSVDWNDIPDSWVGTGGPEQTVWLSAPVYSGISTLSTDYNWDNYVENGRSYNITTDVLAGLRDSGLQEQFNTWFGSQTDRLKTMEDPLEKYLTPEVLDCDILDINTSISPSHTMAGNLISLSVVRYDMLHAYDTDAQMLLESRGITNGAYAVFDLSTGRQLTISDLFVDGTDLDALLNPMIAAALAATEGETDWATFRSYGGLIRPFRGMPRDYPYFSVSNDFLTIYFPGDNPYLAESYSLTLPLDRLQPYLAQPIAFSTAFIEDTVETFTEFRHTPSVEITAENQELLHLFGNPDMGVRSYRLLDTLGLPGTDAINTQLNEIFGTFGSAPLPDFIADSQNIPESYAYASSVLMPNRAFVQMQISAYVGTPGQSADYRTFARMFDPYTGEAVPLSAILNDEECALGELAYQGLIIEDADTHYGWYCYGPNEIYVCGSNDLSPTYTLPSEYFNLDYFSEN